jgi:hypothetical protein
MVVAMVASAALWLTAGGYGQQPPSRSATPQFHGTYEELKPAQRQLLDEWYADYNKLTGDHADAKEYNQYSLSTRTTFEAVTHALMTTTLTDKSGKPMGTALDLVEAIEAINGKVPRARGDLQFRMYVVLKPEALEKLKGSQEFFRDHDNTVYHRGYPMSYRQDGTPSIQFSMSKDGQHADIDVDYRSSSIPAGLFNGHLTAANSDVRAGNNTQVHLQRWQGLTDWWRSLFGLPGKVDDTSADLLAGDVPSLPRKADGKLEDAVQDFLQSWLVEQKPELAAAYLAPSSFACLEEYGPQSGRVINAGNAPYVAARDLAATSKSLGSVSKLGEAVKPATLEKQGTKPLKQPYSATFAVYELPNAVAAEFDCDPERGFEEFDKSRVAGTTGKPSGYFAAVFRVQTSAETSDPIALVWSKEGKYWKVVAWDMESAGTKAKATPDLRRQASAAKATKENVKADPALLQATHDFLHTWLVEDNFDKAANYVSPRCYECVGLYLAEGEKAPSTAEENAAYVRKALTVVGTDVGKVEHLKDAMAPVRPTHDELRTVEHAGESAYTLVAVPDSLSGAFLCAKLSTKNPYVPPEGTAKPVYGNYYATLFAFRTAGEHPAALTLLWAKDGGAWKIVSYEVTAP